MNECMKSVMSLALGLHSVLYDYVPVGPGAPPQKLKYRVPAAAVQSALCSRYEA